MIYKRKVKYYSTGKRLTRTEWDKMPAARGGELARIQASFKNSYDKVNAIQKLVNDEMFSFDRLDMQFDRAAIGSLNDSLRFKNDTLKRQEQIGTMKYYENILHDVERFAGKDIPLEKR